MTWTPAQRNGFVLIADGFEEVPAIGCMRALREAGAAAALVSLRSGLVRGSRGISVQPDLSLDEAVDESVTLVVLPGGRRSASAVLTDPRAHRLLQVVSSRGGQIGLLRSTGRDLEQLLPAPPRRQGALSIGDFMMKLLSEPIPLEGTNDEEGYGGDEQTAPYWRPFTWPLSWSFCDLSYD